VDPSPVDLDRIEAAVGWRPASWRHVAGDRGTTGTSARWVVVDGSRSAFVKLGTTPLTAEWFRREHETYTALHGRFIPAKTALPWAARALGLPPPMPTTSVP
jgi:hypothetical protein